MTTTMSAPCNTLCQGCGRLGFLAIGDYSRPAWCRCQKERLGPLVVAPGFVIVLRFESEVDAAKREEGRLLGNAERAARDNLSFRFVRCGSGWRELPRSSPKRRALEAGYRKALRALQAFQATCAHATRSIYDSGFCDVCHAFVAKVPAEGAHEMARAVGAGDSERVSALAAGAVASVRRRVATRGAA